MKEKLRARLLELIEDQYTPLKPEVLRLVQAEFDDVVKRLGESDQFHFVIRYPYQSKMLMVTKLVSTDDTERITISWYNVSGEPIHRLADFALHSSEVVVSGRSKIKTEDGQIYVKGKTWNELGFNKVPSHSWIDILTGGPKDDN